MSAPLQPALPPPADPAVAQLFAQMQQQLDKQSLQLDAHEKQRQADARELAYARLKIQLLEERLRKMRIAKYGRASEKLSDLQLELLELEPGVSGEEVQAESEREPLAASSDNADDSLAGQGKAGRKQREKKHPGRQTLPAHLERIEKIIACAAAQCACGQCGKETAVIGYEESEVLDVKPAEYFVTVVKREKRACKRGPRRRVFVAGVEAVRRAGCSRRPRARAHPPQVDGQRSDHHRHHC